MKRKQPSLAFCLFMDALGMLNYVVPVLGEFTDIAWAPISAFIFFLTFGSWKGTLFNFAEEILPGVDFIPTFTIMWFMQRKQKQAGVSTPIRIG
ncbi:hypothetical protein [Pollutibacter soli]|uniref:hypothetical protein n=1 Tax=Pollutibacter soli TaxID=3034157 RepID=UPI003013A2A3